MEHIPEDKEERTEIDGQNSLIGTPLVIVLKRYRKVKLSGKSIKTRNYSYKKIPVHVSVEIKQTSNLRSFSWNLYVKLGTKSQKPRNLNLIVGGKQFYFM